MNIPVWVAELAAWFWERAGEAEPFPRKLLGPIANAVPLTVVFPPRLTIASILHWLRENGIGCHLETPDRPLHACLVARDGHGFAFIDGTDAENQQRFSLAHELAHFLRDYLDPRRRMVRGVGPAALEILDGHRRPTNDERVHALLSQTTIGYHVHFLDRDAVGEMVLPAVVDAEDSADRLAYELLAPAEQVSSTISTDTQPASRARIIALLKEQYGLPDRQAARYADLLCSSPRRRDPLLLDLIGGA